MKFWITQHAKERYIERVLNGVNIVDGDINVAILTKISAGRDITNKVYDECPRYILYLYERYKQLGLTIMQSGNIIFITRKRKGAYQLHDVLTCYLDDGRLLSQFRDTVLTREQVFLKIKEIKKKVKL